VIHRLDESIQLYQNPSAEYHRGLHSASRNALVTLFLAVCYIPPVLPAYAVHRAITRSSHPQTSCRRCSVAHRPRKTSKLHDPWQQSILCVGSAACLNKTIEVGGRSSSSHSTHFTSLPPANAIPCFYAPVSHSNESESWLVVHK
jgi:hypothetical protein